MGEIIPATLRVATVWILLITAISVTLDWALGFTQAPTWFTPAVIGLVGFVLGHVHYDLELEVSYLT